MIDEMINSYDLNLTFVNNLVADLDDTTIVEQPFGFPNHPAWTIGHLVYSCEQIGGEIAISPWLAGDWRERFGTGSTPVDSADRYPDKVTLLDALGDGQRRIVARLGEMSVSDLREPLPDVRYRERLPTIGHAVLHILASHTAMHIGQLTVWRRLMGLPSVREPLNEQGA